LNGELRKVDWFLSALKVFPSAGDLVLLDFRERGFLMSWLIVGIIYNLNTLPDKLYLVKHCLLPHL
jgi:hypothetical protein